MLPTASRKLDFSEVPVIDLSPSRFATPEEKKRLADEVAEACARVGFLYLKNHCIPQLSIDEMFAASRDFFALPLEAKMAVSMELNRSYQGYIPLLRSKGRRIMENIKPNMYEVFQIRHPMEPDDPEVLAGRPLAGPIPWPKALPELKEVMLGYFYQMNALGKQMIELFELGLDLPKGDIAKHFKKDINQHRIMYYPPQKATDSADHLGTRAHTDTSAFTFVYQDDVGGLQIRNRDGDWVAVPPIPGTFVMNIGEVLKVWTDGVFSSTPHRVINTSGRERYSVPYFMNPTYQELITPKIKNPDPENVAPEDLHTSMSRAKPFIWGEFKYRNYQRLQPSMDDTVQIDDALPVGTTL